MDVLVLGGSVFLGRAVVREALAAGNRVAVFNRGRSGAPVPGVEQVTGDRTDARDLEHLRGRRFDLVVDTCGYVPAEVARSAEVLAGSCAHYAFVSSINAYPGWPTRADYRDGGVHGGDPDATRADVPGDLGPGEAYGWLKAGCELAVQRAFGAGRSAVLRAGAIVGPEDREVGRLPWWIDRVARGGEVLVPGAPQAPVALVDARDLARFALSRVAGVFETPGPTGRDTRADLMTACREATDSDAVFTWIEDETWLVDQGVAPWTEMPLWAPQAQAPGLYAHHSEQAQAAGLAWRPLADTVTDTWAWQRSLGSSWSPTQAAPGLDAEREQALLAAWHAR